MADTKAERFQRVLARLFQPFARAMIAHHVPYNAASDALKRALFKAAKEGQRHRKKLNQSEISLLTGLHRKDVKRFASEIDPPPDQTSHNAATLAVAIWQSDKRFQTETGLPAQLQRVGDQNRAGFDELLRAARIDLPDGTVLKALIKEEVVSVDGGNNTLILAKKAFIAGSNTKSMLVAYEKNLMAHLNASTDNLIGEEGDDENYERAAHYNRLSRASLEELELEARRLAQDTLEQLNVKALAMQERDHSKKEPKGRFSIGTYIFSDQPTSKRKKDKES